MYVATSFTSNAALRASRNCFGGLGIFFGDFFGFFFVVFGGFWFLVLVWFWSLFVCFLLMGGCVLVVVVFSFQFVFHRNVHLKKQNKLTTNKTKKNQKNKKTNKTNKQ